jgi:predicted histone-like DNA-binding protein
MLQGLEQLYQILQLLYQGLQHVYQALQHKKYKEKKKILFDKKTKRIMANYILKELPDGMSEGKKIIYPKMQTYTMHDYDEVIKHMRIHAGSISDGIIRGVMDALIQTMKTWMPMGHTIKIDGLGLFSLSLGFDTNTPSEKAMAKQQKGGDESSQKTSHRHVCIKGVNFKPDAGFIADMNKQTEFERAMPGVQKPRKETLSIEERIAKALEIIDSKGYMTLSDFASAISQGRTVASRYLKDIVANPESPITVRGSHSHKVWVRKESKN